MLPGLHTCESVHHSARLEGVVPRKKSTTACLLAITLACVSGISLLAICRPNQAISHGNLRLLWLKHALTAADHTEQHNAADNEGDLHKGAGTVCWRHALASCWVALQCRSMTHQVAFKHF